MISKTASSSSNLCEETRTFFPLKLDVGFTHRLRPVTDGVENSLEQFTTVLHVAVRSTDYQHCSQTAFAKSLGTKMSKSLFCRCLCKRWIDLCQTKNEMILGLFYRCRRIHFTSGNTSLLWYLAVSFPSSLRIGTPQIFIFHGDVTLL